MKSKIKMKKYFKRLLLIAGVIIINILNCINSVYAVNNRTERLYKVGDCGSLLKYNGINVKVSYIEYENNGKKYPAYCLNKTKPGAENGAYDVDVNNMINDVKLWRIIINGYPYKTLKELGVQSREEAFTATKQAVYCYIHKNKVENYRGIGEAGERTLNALRKILNDASNSKETKISNSVDIEKENTIWKQDEKEKEYVSKIFKVNSRAQIENYNIIVKNKKDNKEMENIKITDINNIEKKEFNPNEKFKIMIPIKEMKESGEILIEIDTKIKTKPILYGQAPNSNLQDYALTTFEYEDGLGKTEDSYEKNETKIIIIKKEQENNKKLEGVEFELLNDKKEVVYTDLKTDKNGKIEIDNLIPGQYYIKETKELEGYQKYNELILAEVKLNQEMTITINNQKKEIPKIETKSTNEKEYSSKEIKRLPVTGM